MLTANLVKEKALNHGFDLAGITNAEPLQELAAILKDKEQKGKRTVFVTAGIKQRTEPKMYFVAAKSILMLGLNYYFPSGTGESAGGKFARYAWGEDYHLIFRDKLARLTAELKQIEPLVECKPFADTGPLVERELAKKAGLGFIGKNSTLINPELGSWILLGGLALNWELKADLPLEDNCGSCELCLRACPSGAIERPYQVESGRCLSYLTQKRTCLDINECRLLQNRIFGCDTCQEVCPINRKAAKITAERRFWTKDHPSLTPEAILQLTKKEFEGKFAETAISWVGINPVKRNALIVLANKKKAKALPYLISSLSEASPLLRGQAALLLGAYQDKAASAALGAALQREKDSLVYSQIQLSLQQMNE
ncbi:MAG: tRNA epoxyqueuosine(34) reductase QueG [Bacillota bacterium]